MIGAEGGNHEEREYSRDRRKEERRQGRVRREGLRIYTAAIQAHEDPYLPVLEEKVPELSSLSRIPLGIISVPLSRVLGSVSMGRSRAFTKGFLPILEGGSEFAAKWDRLYDSVESEGVNQPITALEYISEE